MPPRYAYWTILAGGLPTAFRTTEREELLPTFKRIQEKHLDAQMKYFARGKLWESKDAADAQRTPPATPDRRGRDWRPGGEHRDPRQKFIDAKKDRNLDRRKERFERKNRPEGGQPWRDRPPREKPHGDPLRAKSSGPSGPAKGPWRDRPAREGRPPGREGRPPPREGRPPALENQWRDRSPREKPHGDKQKAGNRPPGRPTGRPPARPPGRPTGRPPGDRRRR